MGRLDWDKEAKRKKRQLVASARLDQPRTIKAKFAGRCNLCGKHWQPGVALARSWDDIWVHAACATRRGDDLHARMKARREALKEQPKD
jgi:hypothetical protein